MKMKEEADLVTTSGFYELVILKLNNTIATFKHLPDISRCEQTFEVLEQAAYSRDAQINHLLSITNCLLKYLPNSPAMEHLFTNFLKDYIHLVNPEMPAYGGALYLQENFIQSQDQAALNDDHPYFQQT
jgi:hypothetical protein